MPELSTNTSPDFLFAKLHGIWANAVHGELLERLMKSATPELLQRGLSQIGLDASSREKFHTGLALRELNMLGRIALLLDEKGAGFYRALASRVYFNNIKLVLHYRFFPQGGVDIQNLLLQAPGQPEFKSKELLDAKTTAAFLALLPLHCGVTAGELAGIVNALEKDNDIMTAECALDQLYYGKVLAAAGRCPFGMAAQARRLAAIEIDIVNLCMLLRNAKTYHFAPERMKKLWLDGGLMIPRRQLEQLSELNSAEIVVSALTGVFQRLLSPLAGGDLYLSENALWKYLHQEALKLFRDFDCPSRSVAAFPFLMHFETLNIGRIYEGVHFGIPARDMQDMMIGA